MEGGAWQGLTAAGWLAGRLWLAGWLWLGQLLACLIGP